VDEAGVGEPNPWDFSVQAQLGPLGDKVDDEAP
jgi:hypothetical protein